MNKYSIEKDNVLNKYVVWEKHRNYLVMVYSGYKYQCVDYIKYIVGGYFETV